VVKPEQIIKARKSVDQIFMDEKIEQYIIDLVFATRDPQSAGLKDIAHFIEYGGSPRASINLAKAAKAQAFLNRRGFVIPEDVRSIAVDVLRHRIGLNYEAEAQQVSVENIISTVLDKIVVL